MDFPLIVLNFVLKMWWGQVGGVRVGRERLVKEGTTEQTSQSISENAEKWWTSNASKSSLENKGRECRIGPSAEFTRLTVKG